MKAPFAGSGSQTHLNPALWKEGQWSLGWEWGRRNNIESRARKKRPVISGWKVTWRRKTLELRKQKPKANKTEKNSHETTEGKKRGGGGEPDTKAQCLKGSWGKDWGSHREVKSVTLQEPQTDLGFSPLPHCRPESWQESPKQPKSHPCF